MDDGYLIQPSFPSTHPMWGGTPKRRVGKCTNGNFNQLTPCGVGQISAEQAKENDIFQSTHPVWGGTQAVVMQCTILVFQSTHPVWGGTGGVDPSKPADLYFNPPTPCGVGRPVVSTMPKTSVFQSTHPVWGGTVVDQQCHF